MSLGASMGAAAGAPNQSILGERGGLLTDVAMAEVERRVPILTDEGGGLWYYAGGVWHPRAERKVTNIIVELTGAKYRTTHAATVINALQSREPEIADIPDPYSLNVRDGLLDWRKAATSPAAALTDHGHTNRPPSILQFPVSWAEARKASTDTADRFLSEVFPDGEAGVSFAYEVLGYGLFDGNPLHKAIMLDGSGRNGKSTFLDLARELYGPHNVSGVSLQSLGDNRFAPAQLHGKAANIAGDLDSRALKDSGPFKMITGEDLLLAEHKYGQPFPFTARCLPIFAANEKPLSSDASIGYLSRWIVVPFLGYFPEGAADPDLKAKLAAEVPGVFYKAVLGLRRLMDRRAFDPPPSIEAATKAYRAYIDPIRSFISEGYLIMALNEPAKGHADQTEVFRAYRRWAEDNGYHSLGARKFNDRFPTAIHEAYGVTPGPRTVDGRRRWTHVELVGGAGEMGGPA